MAARRYYGADMPGFSIPAAEHSTMTSWGRDREEAAYANMLDQFEGEDAPVAVVSDSYDLDAAIDDIWGGTLKAAVENRRGTLVVRPDSGDPVDTPARVLAKLWDIFGGSTNSKDYRVLSPRVRVIQGDGMNVDSIAQLVDRVISDGFAIDNIAFGMGGGLLQSVTRDTLRFAMKANAMRDSDGAWHDVSKCPATDPGKASKAGRQAVVLADGAMVARRLDEVQPDANLLQPVWRNGELLQSWTFDQVRERANP